MPVDKGSCFDVAKALVTIEVATRWDARAALHPEGFSGWEVAERAFGPSIELDRGACRATARLTTKPREENVTLLSPSIKQYLCGSASEAVKAWGWVETRALDRKPAI